MNEQTFQERQQALAADRAHGASELARQALDIAAESARHAPAADAPALRQALRTRAADLAAARPSMAPLHNVMAQWRRRLDDLDAADLDSLRQAAADAATDLIQQSETAALEAARHASQLIPSGQTVITHSFSSTVQHALRLCRAKAIHVIATESRPLYEGHELAQQLSDWAIATTLITDAQMGLYAQRADLALVGADSLLPDGAVINKVGTYLLALAARAAGIPFYVCCERFKQRTADMGEPELEEMDPGELGAPHWPHVTIRNVYFEITPAHLITAWINERGVERTTAGG